MTRYFNAGFAGGPLAYSPGTGSTPRVNVITTKCPAVPGFNVKGTIYAIQGKLYNSKAIPCKLIRVMWNGPSCPNGYSIRTASPFYFSVAGQMERDIGR